MLVPAAPLRERFLALQKNQGLTATEVARRAGWFRSPPRDGWVKADSQRVLRVLRLSGEHNSDTIQVEQTALDLARALHLDPVDIGL